MRLALRALAGLAVLAVALAAALYFAIRPPAPLPSRSGGRRWTTSPSSFPAGRRAEHRRLVVAGEHDRERSGPRATAGPFAGMYVLPGLADLHVHFPPAALPGQTELFAFLFLYHGVTAVRDAGDVDGTASEPARRGIAEGRFPGPRVLACGPFVDGEPPLWKNSLRRAQPRGGPAAVEPIADARLRLREGVQRARRRDARRGARGGARARPAADRPRAVARALRGGATRRRAAPDRRAAPAPPTRTCAFPRMLRDVGALDDERLEQLIADSERSDRSRITPTLVTHRPADPQRGLRGACSREPDVAASAALLPRGGVEPERRHERRRPASTPEDFAMVRRAFARDEAHACGALLRAGAPRSTPAPTRCVAFVVPGASLHRELRLLRRRRLHARRRPSRSRCAPRPPTSACRASARCAPGAPAELLIFRDDPPGASTRWRRLAGVVRDGRLYPRDALDAQLARYRAHFDGALYDAIVTPLVRRALAATREP